MAFDEVLGEDGGRIKLLYRAVRDQGAKLQGGDKQEAQGLMKKEHLKP